MNAFRRRAEASDPSPSWLKTMRAPSVAEINIETRTVEIARVLDLVESFAERHAIPASATASVAICVDELLSNAIRYGYPDGRPGRILVAMRLEADAFCVTVEHDGLRFDPRRALPQVRRGADPSPIGGYGLALMHALVDELSYRSAQGLNVTSLKKRLGSPPSALATAAPPDRPADA
jgi:anti-sigma regulatory factor (Ser/Thr protein kinase)